MKSIFSAGLMLFGHLIALSSCVQTMYGPNNYKGGYRELQIADDRFELAAWGNAYAAKHTIRDYFLYRAAELTLENGGQYFLLFGDKTAKRPITVSAVIPVRGSLMRYGISGTKFSSNGVIKILQEVPAGEKIFYDAKLISDQLEGRIRESSKRKRDSTPSE